MAATTHVMVTNGVRFPGYSLFPTPMGIPAAGIFFSDEEKKKKKNSERKKKSNNEKVGF